MEAVVATDRLQQALSEYFGFNSFKDNQKYIIEKILEGRDTMVIMPTGGGKSLCYQLPAIMNEGTALIISPLIALMKNQVDMMRGYSSIDSIAHFMNSSLSRSQLKKVKEDLLSGATKMLYVAPETLTKPDTIEFFKQIKISFVAVDEAHCISEWGHDFRPEYRRIREMVDAIDETVPIVALTATATPKVRTDIMKNLRLKNPYTYIASFNRDNLYYEVRPKGKKEQVLSQIIQFIKGDDPKSGIIYCLNRKTTEQIAESLRANGIKAAAYHAGLDSNTRSNRQDQFLQEDINVIVATIAFGMGIDKPDVRFVIHFNMPKSLENYYQETGRAGRDGMEGNCIGFFNYQDMTKLEKFMRDKPVAEREIGGQHLAEVIGYAESAGCRRQYLLHYFGEDYDVGKCKGHCDNCRNPREKHEVKDLTQRMLMATSELQENYPSKYIIDFLMGSKAQEISDFKHNKLPSYNKGKEHDTTFWNSVITQALLNNLIKKDIENYGLLKITEKGHNFVKEPYSIQIAVNHNYDDVNAMMAENEPQRATALDSVLIKMLKDLRRKVAKQKSIPTYVIFQDRSLEEMATYYPITKKELENITGVSRGKAAKYGREFLKLIGKYVEDNDIERAYDLVVKTTGSKSKDKIYIIQNIDKRIPLDAIGKHLNLDMESLIIEVERIVDAGTKLDLTYHINNVLDEYQQEELFEYFMETENPTIKDAMTELDDDEYTEEDIRLMYIQFMAKMAH
ncbi:MAG: DNA helicase RecQ [Chitinophagales bacterium]